MSKRVLVVYHFFYPDDVVSSRHLSDFAEGLATRGWDVTALTSNRICREPQARLDETEETWRGVKIHRVNRPAFDQSSNAGRLMNSVWLMAQWLRFIARQPPYDVLVLGTDPQFGYFMLPLVRLLKRRTKLAYWGFDLYPEAIMANDMGIFSKLARLMHPLTGFCYRRIDAMVDIGPCMRNLLDGYKHRATRATLVPWALAEPEAPLKPDAPTREDLFGDVKLGLLYSGTIGKAHTFGCFIALARELRKRGASVGLCFAGRGNRYEELRAMVTEEDTNISFAGFADENELTKRLGAGDIHMLSLRPGWEGIVVPSKFFGSLAAGKPLLYEGTPNSAIKTWIDRFHVGYVLDENNVQKIADELCRLAENPDSLQEMQQNAFTCYHEHFSQETVINGWDTVLQELLDETTGA